MEQSIPLILIVDDEPAVTNLLVYNLTKAHYRTATAANGFSAIEAARQYSPDIILLDLMLPGMDGLDVCRELRRTSKVPIIMITARDEEVDRVVGLELGADDYIGKPFSIRELMSRIKAVLRRTRMDEVDKRQAVSVAGNLSLDLETREASVGSQVLNLTRLEFDLLYTLILNEGKVMTREKLLDQVWGYDYGGDTRTVDSMIKRLRASLRNADPDCDGIEAVRGLGYKYIRG